MDSTWCFLKMAVARKKGRIDKIECDDCNIEVGTEDKALICAVCDKWYHIKCQRVSVSDYNFLQKTDESIQWFCKGCKGASQKLYKMLSLVHKRQDHIEKQVEECKQSLDTQSKSMEKVCSDVSSLRNSLPIIINDIYLDKQEQESRESNLIFFNIKENTNGNDKMEDTVIVRAVCEEALNINVDIKELQRLGKFVAGSEKDRPLKVTIEKRETRGGILRNSYKLRNNSKFKKVGIGRDLTKKQRETNMVMRKDLLKMRVDQPEKTWGIRRDKIVELPGYAHMPGLPMGSGDGIAK